MESQSQSPIVKVAAINKHITAYKEKMNNRMARLLWQSKELQPSYTVSAPRTLQSTQSNNFHQLENPLVLGSILAGVVGVVIIAVIILGVWIRSRMLRGGGSKSSSPSRTRQNEHVEIDSTVITSSISMSTLDFDENEETQMESLQLDDTTFYSANDVSIPVERDGGELGISSSYQIGSVDERTLCEITLSPS